MPAPKDKQVFYSIIINGKIHDVTGRKRTPAGYITLCIKDHPFSDINGYIFEHRVIMETKLGRYLQPGEIVHHKNEIKHNNCLSNLELMNHTKHTIMHHTGAKRSTETKEKISQAAKRRLSSKENHPLYKEINKNEFLDVILTYGPTKASEIFGISRKTVYNKIKEFNLEERYKHDK